MLLFIVGLLCKGNPADSRLTFNDGSKRGYLKSNRYKAGAEFFNAKDFAYAIISNYLLFIKVIFSESAILNPSYLFILTLDYSSAINTDNISILIVWIYSPAGINNPKKIKNYSLPGNELPYCCKKYGIYFKDIAKNNWYLFTHRFTPGSITRKTNAIYNINLGELVGK